MKVKISVICQHGDFERELMLPGKYVICSRCDGSGKHVNPAIDGNGISGEEMAADPDFAESYMSGVFDVKCEECGGERVVGQVDLKALPKALRKRLSDQYEHEELERRERAHEAQLRASGIEY